MVSEPLRALSATGPAGPREQLAREFLHFLEDERVRYVFLGDPRTFESGLPQEIDIAVEQSSIGRLPSLIWRFCQPRGVHLIRVRRHEWNACNFTMAWRPAPGAALQLLQLDVCAAYGRGGRRWLEASELIDSRVRTALPAGDPEIFVPSPHVSFLAYLLKKVDKHELEPRHAEFLGTLWARDPQGCGRQLRRFWSAAAVQLIERSVERGDAESVLHALPALRRELRRNRRRSAGDGWREIRRLCSRIAHPIGYWVAFLGPDGAGKSTIAQQLGRELAPAFRTVRFHHLRPHVLGRSRASGPVVDPHGAPPRGRLTSIAKLLLWWLDCTVGFLIDVFPALVRSTLVVFDRHSLDLLVDPVRYRYGGSLRLAERLLRRTFQPSLFVLLDAPVEVLQARKQEVTALEAARQREKYRALTESLPNGQVVDASVSTEAVAREVIDLVVERLARRTAERLELHACLAAPRSHPA